jgi:hypothetical protein
MRFAKLAVACAVLSLSDGPRAWASLIINPTFGPSITGDGNAAAIEGAINSAISAYEANFADPITVNITFNEMAGGLGQSSTSFFNISYASYLAALTADSKTADDATAILHLPTLAEFTAFYGVSTINIKTANARAVGLPAAVSSDGTIGLNTALTFPGSPGTSSTYSLIVVAEHEIDEVLGLGSALPAPQFNSPFPEDLFRYTAAGARSFTASGSATAFFSIDGTTDLAQFDNQNDGGDFGDWQSNPLPPGVQPKVQDAFATAGATPALGVELRVLDVIGFDRVSPAPVPEPGTGLLFAAASVVFAGFAKARRA